MSLHDEIEELEKEIAALSAEIVPLQEKHDQIVREVSLFEAENKHIKYTKPDLPRKHVSPQDFELDDPPTLIHHSHFDPSIEKYFRSNSSKVPIETGSNDSILAKIQLKTAAGRLALKESILRFGGITAFAINERLYNTEDDALLGLRFDVLSHASGKFLKPHYIILRRRQIEAKDGILSKKWHVFRYTTPAYVHLDQFGHYLLHENEDYGLQRFVESVRSSLVSVQYKHDKVDQLASYTYNTVFENGSDDQIVSKLDKDLECRRIVLSLENQSSSVRHALEIELLCDHMAIETVTCRFGEANCETIVQMMLQGCDFQNLGSVFKDVVKYLRQNGIL
ncbi:hypothetical protein OY671_003848 [Metschnikowia pulcherrima]|nr:hypothetical protein OY671_003848 [Metschnikowia pulcherrima]